MIHKDLGDIRALTLIRVVLERTEDQKLRKSNFVALPCWQCFTYVQLYYNK